MNDTLTVPADVYRRLVVGFTVGLADVIITGNGSTRGQVLIGDPGGEVFAWLWRNDQDRCMSYFADLVAELRVHHRQAPEPAIRLSDVLDGLRFSWPDDFSRSDREAFAAAARSDVPRYFGSDPNE